MAKVNVKKLQALMNKAERDGDWEKVERIQDMLDNHHERTKRVRNQEEW